MASTESRPRRAEGRAGAILEIDLDAIAGNFRKLAERVGPHVRIAAVVKADAYGLGMEKVAPALARAGAKTFFVATLDEALALRELLPRAQIAVLVGVNTAVGLGSTVMVFWMESAQPLLLVASNFML